MKKNLSYLIVLFFIISIISACNSSEGKDKSDKYRLDDKESTEEVETETEETFEFVGVDMKLNREGKFEAKNISKYLPGDSKTVYLVSDDTGWEDFDFNYSIQADKLVLDFSKIEEIGEGVLRFGLKTQDGFLDFNELPEKDRAMFFRETAPSSRYGAGDVVLAILFHGDWYSPVPTETVFYERDQINWPVEYREPEQEETEPGVNPEPESTHYVSVQIDKDQQKAFFENIQKGFDIDEIGEVRLVSEKVGWSFDQGVIVSIDDGTGEVDLSEAMFHSGTTRFGIINRVDGKDYWFDINSLNPDSRVMLERQTDSPGDPGDGDIAMALKDMTDPVDSWLVPAR